MSDRAQWIEAIAVAPIVRLAITFIELSAAACVLSVQALRGCALALIAPLRAFEGWQARRTWRREERMRRRVRRTAASVLRAIEGAPRA